MFDNHLVMDFLSGFVSEERRNRIEEVLAGRTRYISILLEDIYQSQNASAVLRTCECFGIQDVHVIENYNRYDINPMVLKGSDKWLTIRKFNGSANNSTEALNQLKSEGYRIVATSLQGENANMSEFDLRKGKCVIVFGNEHQGVSENILQQADEHLKIPMSGFTQSLNISVSAGVILSHLVYRLKQTDICWQLTSFEKEELRLKWLKNSVKAPEMLIKRLNEENIHPK